MTQDKQDFFRQSQLVSSLQTFLAAYGVVDAKVLNVDISRVDKFGVLIVRVTSVVLFPNHKLVKFHREFVLSEFSFNCN